MVIRNVLPSFRLSSYYKFKSIRNNIPHGQRYTSTTSYVEIRPKIQIVASSVPDSTQIPLKLKLKIPLFTDSGRPTSTHISYPQSLATIKSPSNSNSNAASSKGSNTEQNQNYSQSELSSPLNSIYNKSLHKESGQEEALSEVYPLDEHVVLKEFKALLAKLEPLLSRSNSNSSNKGEPENTSPPSSSQNQSSEWTRVEDERDNLYAISDLLHELWLRYNILAHNNFKSNPIIPRNLVTRFIKVISRSLGKSSSYSAFQKLDMLDTIVKDMDRHSLNLSNDAISSLIHAWLHCGYLTYHPTQCCTVAMARGKEFFKLLLKEFVQRKHYLGVKTLIRKVKANPFYSHENDPSNARLKQLILSSSHTSSTDSQAAKNRFKYVLDCVVVDSCFEALAALGLASESWFLYSHIVETHADFNFSAESYSSIIDSFRLDKSINLAGYSLITYTEGNESNRSITSEPQSLTPTTLSSVTSSSNLPTSNLEASTLSTTLSLSEEHVIIRLNEAIQSVTNSTHNHPSFLNFLSSTLPPLLTTNKIPSNGLGPPDIQDQREYSYSTLPLASHVFVKGLSLYPTHPHLYKYYIRHLLLHKHVDQASELIQLMNVWNIPLGVEESKGLLRCFMIRKQWKEAEAFLWSLERSSDSLSAMNMRACWEVVILGYAQAGNTSKVVYWIKKMRKKLGHPRASVYEKCVHLMMDRGLGSRDVNIRNANTVYLCSLEDGITPTKTMIDAVEDMKGISVEAHVDRMHQLHLTSSYSITP